MAFFLLPARPGVTIEHQDSPIRARARRDGGRTARSLTFANERADLAMTSHAVREAEISADFGLGAGVGLGAQGPAGPI
jgi:hypothetical protein